MNFRLLRRTNLTILFTLLISSNGFAWGFWAHKRINRIAVFTLPPELFGFYKQHIDYLTEHAVDPDKRRYAAKGEAPRHYIDLDHYCMLPCDDFPRTWKDAAELYPEDTLQAYGIVPWHIQRMLWRLTEAFTLRDRDGILQVSAELGHYIADAHVPLHTTENYNGQLTGQKGIHGFWESRLPELFGEEYNYFVDPAGYLKRPMDEIWEFVLESHRYVDSVLLVEKRLKDAFSPDRVYAYEQRGEGTVRVYSREYSLAYSDALKGMVEQRMRSAIVAVGCFWMTAWVDAGQPDLSKLDEPLPEVASPGSDTLKEAGGDHRSRTHPK